MKYLVAVLLYFLLSSAPAAAAPPSCSELAKLPHPLPGMVKIRMDLK